MGANKENTIEWYTGDSRCTVSLTSKRYITRVRKLAVKHPEDIEIVENTDGSICAHLPLSCIKINEPSKKREMTDEQREVAAERLKLAREKALEKKASNK